MQRCGQALGSGWFEQLSLQNFLCHMWVSLVHCGGVNHIWGTQLSCCYGGAALGMPAFWWCSPFLLMVFKMMGKLFVTCCVSGLPACTHTSPQLLNHIVFSVGRLEWSAWIFFFIDNHIPASQWLMFSRGFNVQCEKEHLPYQRLWSCADNFLATLFLRHSLSFFALGRFDHWYFMGYSAFYLKTNDCRFSILLKLYVWYISYSVFFTHCWLGKIWFSENVLHNHANDMSLIQKLTPYHLYALNAKNIDNTSGECAGEITSFEMSVFSRHCNS